MKSILQELYFGRVSPWERRNFKDTERITVNRKIEDETRYFISKMSLDGCQRFQALANLYSQASIIEEAETFSHGFKLGAALMAEVFADEEKTTHCEE